MESNLDHRRELNLLSTEYRFKIVMLGDGAVGKTAMTLRFTQNYFETDYKRTIGTDFSVKRLSLPEYDTDVTLQIWDLAGQPRFESVRQGFYRGARGGLLLFDVTRRRTFLNLDAWKNETFNGIQRSIPLVVVANKIDLKESRVVDTEEGEAYAKENDFIYVESSALTGQNVEDSYVELCERMIDDAKVAR